MRFKNGAADAKPHADAVRLGGKEGIEDLVRLLRGKPYAGIADRDQKCAANDMDNLDGFVSARPTVDAMLQRFPLQQLDAG